MGGEGGTRSRTVALASAWLALACLAPAAPAQVPDGTNPIAIENALAGDTGWRIFRTAGPGELEAYASATSVAAGEAISIHARADGEHTVRWRLYRLGWYGGAEGRLLASGGPAPVRPQPVPAPHPVTGLVACDWPVTFTIQTDAAWTSGIHLVKLTRDDGPETWVIFVLRDDARKGAAVYQQPVTTYQAYNPYGGTSLYVGGGREASFDRPYAEGRGAGQYFRYEHDFVKWAESRGFDVVYVTNLDLERDPSLLTGQRLFLSVGHDEYWSRPMREALEAAVARGVNVAFFSANSVYWQVRLEPSRTTGAPLRTVVGWKKAAPTQDPLRGTPLETSQWRDLGEPENALLGAMYATWQIADAPWIVRNAGAWPYAGTGLTDGDALPLLVGYESDRTFDNGATPSGVTILSRSPVVGTDGRPDRHEAVVRDTPAGGFVFASGTIQWGWGLSRDGVADDRVRRITENVFVRAGLVPELPASAAPPISRRGVSIVRETITPSLLAGAPGAEGLRDGPASEARFRRPTSAALDHEGRLWVTDTGNHAVRVIEARTPHEVVTIVGGTAGSGDGEGPRLRWPQGIAVAPDGTPYVADTGNQRIVRLRRGAAGWRVETVAGRSGWAGDADGRGSEAQFWDPAGLVWKDGALWVIERGNAKLRRVDADGNVTTVAGATGGGFADGPGAQARFTRPTDLAVAGDALVVLDAGNRAVRRVALAPPYRVDTLAGGEGGFGDGPAAEARFMPASGILSTPDGLLVADAGNRRVRAIRGGEVTTWAGAEPAAAARLDGPTGLVALSAGTIVVDGASSTVLLAGVWDEDDLPPPPPPPPATPPVSPPGSPVEAAHAQDGGCVSAPGAAPGALVAVLALLVARAFTGRRGRRS